MEKRCKDCKYKVYQKVDTKEVWPFCACKDKELRDITNNFMIEVNKSQMHTMLPSCQLVQSAYDILLDSRCDKYCVEQVK